MPGDFNIDVYREEDGYRIALAGELDMATTPALCVRLSPHGFFYPKADTPGRTTQACGVRDHQSDYASTGAAVIGLSPDPVSRVKKFHDKDALNFPLLADEDHAVAETYGVWPQKSMYGRTYWGVRPTTFVVDADGVVAKVLKDVKPAQHDQQVLDALRDIRPVA